MKSNAAWREIGNKKSYFRSKWEANFARYLEWQKEKKYILDWFHEPSTFWFDGIKRGCVSYCPDFKIINLDNTHHWIEVKGYLDPKSKTKIKRFSIYYPEEKLEVIDKNWFARNNGKMKILIQHWE